MYTTCAHQSPAWIPVWNFFLLFLKWCTKYSYVHHLCVCLQQREETGDSAPGTPSKRAEPRESSPQVQTSPVHQPQILKTAVPQQQQQEQESQTQKQPPVVQQQTQVAQEQLCQQLQQESQQQQQQQQATVNSAAVCAPQQSTSSSQPAPQQPQVDDLSLVFDILLI